MLENQLLSPELKPTENSQSLSWQTQIAIQLVPTVVLVMMGVVITFAIADTLDSSVENGYAQLAHLALFVFSLFIWIDLKRGNISRVTRLMHYLAFFGASFGALWRGAHWVFLLPFLVIALYSWMLLEAKMAIRFTILALVASMGLIYIRTQNIYLPGSFEPSPVRLALIAIVNFVALAILTRQMAGYISSITTRLHKNVERLHDTNSRLEMSEAHYRAVTTIAPNGIVMVDQKGCIQFVNPAMTEIFGWKKEELLEQPLTILMQGGHTKAHEVGFARFVQTGHRRTDRIQVGIPGQHKNGDLLKLAIAFESTIQDEAEFYVGYVQDVTEQLALESVVSKSKELESLGLLAGGIAHDFNNLLTVMLAQSSLIQHKLGHEHTLQKNVEKVMSAATKAAALTKQMLAYSGRSRFEIGRQNINCLVEENLQLLLAGVDKRIVVTSKLSAELPEVEADPAQLQQIIMNLLINAADAIRESTQYGKIHVTTTLQQIEQDNLKYGQHTGVSLPAGNYVAIKIEDSGPGMDQATLDRIFDPFFTTKKMGNGLGLAAVIGILRAHHGGMAVSSEPTVGTTFEVLLPALTPPPYLQDGHRQ